MEVLTKRTLLNLIRDPREIMGQAFLATVLALLTGAIYYNVGYGDGALRNRLGFIFFMLTQFTFGNISATSAFLEQKRMIRNETANGYYRISAFFFVKVLCDVIPMRII